MTEPENKVTVDYFKKVFDNKKPCSSCGERKNITQFRRFNVVRKICNKCNLEAKSVNANV